MPPTEIKITDKPYRVTRPNGDIVAGFLDFDSAEADAKFRNDRALFLGLDVSYIACKKPQEIP